MNGKFFTLPEEKQKRIINAAYVVFAGSSYQKASMSRIAAAGGISKSLLFHYFHWAIAFYEGNVKHVYFVAETKGSLRSMQLRLIEQSKIHCAREHFKAISGDNVVYDVVDSYQSLLEKVMR